MNAIAVVGASGQVGTRTARILRDLGAGPLRLSTRDTEGRRTVDVHDPASLDRFARGCRIVVNCAGPSHAVGDRVARAALRAGAGYVDAAGDDAVYAALGRVGTGGHRVVLSAGLQPGLTGLLPRWAAAGELDTVHGLRVYLGVLDEFTAAAADDFLHAAADGTSEPLAAWRGGTRRSGALTRRDEATLPFLPGPVTLLPALSTESERLARALGLVEGDWYTALTGEHVRAAFGRVRTLDRAEAVAALRRASGLDLAGREPHVLLLVQVDGTRGDGPGIRTVLLRGRGNGELTGAVTALATLAVDRAEVPPGTHFAADVLDPAITIQRLTAAGIAEPVVFDTGIERLASIEEGVL
ncbi:NAD-dependent epimerase/dehydratase family protein [Amycolatopsis cihanbeyliensis]|uniref:NAD-dependent epimerase/dehydratase domain-containing protein n=1 Tax=Amycolatopsis cihanbeyliensis TaxID=1128664 RepID=A0A542DBV8_AMYCI|nr:NAD-dependent epimerase/dehydratase family protein [Amycolatopsis cihanbeyliensis]TQJ00543.1 hypothetical protein FB471_0171 [Amycolatopsis cihanbeyliensis]